MLLKLRKANMTMSAEVRELLDTIMKNPAHTDAKFLRPYGVDLEAVVGARVAAMSLRDILKFQKSMQS